MMTSENNLLPEELTPHQRLESWRVRIDEFQRSDRAAIDIGMMALKTTVLINAGALVALLAFVGQLWNESKDIEVLLTVLDAMVIFVSGLITGAVAVAAAYFYQSFLTAQSFHAIAEMSASSSDWKPLIWTPRLQYFSMIGMVALTTASYGAFVWGAISAILAFKASVSL